MTSPARRATAGLLLLAACVGACTSPESRRTRGGGAGGDPGNRRDMVSLHEGADPYYGTPRLIGPHGAADLAPARHAQRREAQGRDGSR